MMRRGLKLCFIYLSSNRIFPTIPERVGGIIWSPRQRDGVGGGGASMNP